MKFENYQKNLKITRSKKKQKTTLGNKPTTPWSFDLHNASNDSESYIKVQFLLLTNH